MKSECSLTNAMNVIGEKWKFSIIFNLGNKTYRFVELQRAVKGISAVMLSKRLKELEDHGIVVRQVYEEIPPRVEYSLTEKGKSAIPVIESVAKWAENHLVKTK